MGDSEMANTEAYEKGRAMRRRLMGDAYVERMDKTVYTDDTMKKFGDYATEAVFGMLWTRPGIDVKTRTLICVVSDTAMGRDPELAIHLRMARREGWSEDELIEVLMHMSGYVGLPLVREAMITARKVFSEMRAEG
jgi:4-carboxymuconolactone decarboxylase